MFKKSQIAATDLFIALFIATILLVVIIFAWNRYAVILNDDVEYKEMEIIAFQVSDLLVKTKGKPENWEGDPGNVKVIGLASSDRDLSAAKVNALINSVSYSDASKLLGIGFYDFYLQIKYVDGTEISSYGTSVPSDRSVVRIQRLVLYGNEKAILEFALWK